ncbi:MAG TPA: FAD-binding oxidoreductase [Pseudonocardiaceae bacterium]
MLSADVVVVGGGIAGVSIAGELAEHCSVVLLEQESQLAYHTTGRSAATFLESYGGPEIRALTHASRALVDRAGQERGAPLFSPRPLLWVTDRDHLPELDALVAANPTLQRIGVDEARELCPVLDPAYLAGAATEPGAQDVDVLGLHQYYLARARRYGARVLVDTRVESGERSGSRWRLHTTQGPVEADVVVNAAGAWGDDLAARLGVAPIGLSPLRRTIAVAPLDGVNRSWPLVADVAETFYFRPEGPGILLSPADETPCAPCDAKPADLDVALAVERVNAATSLQVRSVRVAWAGLRTFAPDRNPVIGFDPGHEGFFWLVGQGGYGIQSTPATALLATGLITRGTVPDVLTATGLDVTRLSPDRLRG